MEPPSRHVLFVVYRRDVLLGKPVQTVMRMVAEVMRNYARIGCG